MKTLVDLFKDQIEDLLSVETQLISVLPFIACKVNHKKLIKVIEEQIIEVKKQKNRIEIVAKEINLHSSEKKSFTLQEQIRGIKKLISEAANSEVLDVGVMGKVQCIEHYKISEYGTAVRIAKELEHTELAVILQQTLNEVYDVDNDLNTIAEDRINRIALENLK